MFCFRWDSRWQLETNIRKTLSGDLCKIDQVPGESPVGPRARLFLCCEWTGL